MAKIQSHQTQCSCGSGKRFEDCCGSANGCLVIHFPRAKKKNYAVHLEAAISDLIGYARRYFYNWEAAGATRFTSYSQFRDLEEGLSHLFWHWFVINYRFHRDVSPIIDFYIAENEDEMEEPVRPVFAALRESCISVYQVQWIKNNAVCLRDIFCHLEHVVERDFGHHTRVVEEGMLMLARIVQVANTPMVLGRPFLINSENKNYLLEEVHSLRVYEGINDPRLFMKEYAEVVCGLVMDLTYGIKKTRIKSRTLHLEEADRRMLVEKILHCQGFSLLERNERWLKLTWGEGRGLLRRLYLGSAGIIVAAEDQHDLSEVTQILKGILERSILQTPYRWVEGYSFASEEEAEEILVEIMHDKYLEEWLSTGHQELEGLTPLQAIQDVRGRVLLETLLNDMEILELRAKSRGEYYFPTSVIRTKLNLDKNRLNRELLQPEAVAVKVGKHRDRQELSSFITAYNWANEDLRQVAVAAFDLYSGNREYLALAWILFMWSEFSSIYQPKAPKLRGWLAALEHTYLKLTGERVSFARTAKRFGVPSGMVSKHAQLIERHFERYPLDFSVEMTDYPTWEELDDREKVCSYEEVQQHLHMFTYAVKSIWNRSEQESRMEYYELVNTMGRFWDEPTRRVYEQFFRTHYCLDDQNSQHVTLANLFWDNQARRFPPYLKTASFNLMMSYIGAYRVFPVGTNGLIFEDIFTGERHETYGRFGDRVHSNIVPGMISITRLLPLQERYWVSDPMFIVLPDLVELFEKNLHMLMEKLHPFDHSDPGYLKERGEKIVKAYILSLEELEQATVNLMNQPLQMEWQSASMVKTEQVISLLKQNRKFRVLCEDQEHSSFIWMSSNSSQTYQWGYVLVQNGHLEITLPPGKDVEKFIKDIRRSFKSADIVMAFRKLEAGLARQKELERQMVADLAGFFNANPELSLALLRQDDLDNEELEWTQGIFLLKLGSLLMDYLNDRRSHKRG